MVVGDPFAQYGSIEFRVLGGAKLICWTTPSLDCFCGGASSPFLSRRGGTAQKNFKGGILIGLSSGVFLYVFMCARVFYVEFC